jgi:hypothetical protein
MHLAAHIAALIAVLSTGVVYGTDAFCALVQRPALARVDDATLTAAADKHETPANARALQRDWDSIILPGPSCRAWRSPRCA